MTEDLPEEFVAHGRDDQDSTLYVQKAVDRPKVRVVIEGSVPIEPHRSVDTTLDIVLTQIQSEELARWLTAQFPPPATGNMVLKSIRVGDIVRVAGALAVVVEKEPHCLRVRWGVNPVTTITRSRAVRAREVEAHWKRMK